MLRVAIPIILAVASATVFRTLLLPLIVSVLVGLIMAAMKSSAARKGRGSGQTRKEPDNVVDGNYRMVDDEPPK